MAVEHVDHEVYPGTIPASNAGGRCVLKEDVVICIFQYLEPVPIIIYWLAGSLLPQSFQECENVQHHWEQPSKTLVLVNEIYSKCLMGNLGAVAAVLAELLPHEDIQSLLLPCQGRMVIMYQGAWPCFCALCRIWTSAFASTAVDQAHIQNKCFQMMLAQP